MSDILLFIRTILLIWGIYKLLRSLIKRIFLVFKLRAFKKETGAKVKYNQNPFTSLWRFSAKPEITVELGNRIYLIRLIGAASKHRRVHFANPEFTVTTKGKRVGSGSKRMVYSGRTAVRKRFVNAQPNDYPRKVGKVRILPKLKFDADRSFVGKEVVPVLIFNPAPHDVTFVTETKNRVVAAFTGDKVYDQTIFTASSFVTFADRYERERQEAKKSASSFWDEYYS